MHSGTSVDENPFGGEPLRAVAGHCVSVVEVSMSKRVELDLTSIVEARRDMSVWPERIDHSKIAVGDTERFVGGCELNLVADGEVICYLPVDIDAGEAARIIGDDISGWLFDGKQIRRRI